MDTAGIGERIKSIRGNESLDKFAKKVGVHKSTIIRYEKEESFPDANIIFRICNLYTKNPSWFLTGHGDEEWFEKHFWLPEYNEAHDELRARLHGTNYKKIAETYRISERDLIEYVEGNRMLTDDELLVLCDNIAFCDFEAVRSSRKDFQHEHRDTINRFAKQEGAIVDIDLLRDVIRAVEENIQDKNIDLSIDKKVEIIAIIYEEIFEDENKRSLLKEKTARLFNLVV